MSQTPTDRDSSGWSAFQYNSTASFVYSTAFTTPVLDLLDARPGERVIDFGCGSGEVTMKIQEKVGEWGLVVGVDRSESMIGKARANGVRIAFVADIQDLHLSPNTSSASFDTSTLTPSSFDAVFTNAVLHWCKSPPPNSSSIEDGLQGAIAGAARALKSGGRFVGEMGGYMNVVGLRIAIHEVLKRRGIDPVPLDPWHFPSVEEFEQRLLDSSLRPLSVTLHPRFTPLTSSSAGENGLLAWLRLFARPHFFKSLDDETSETVMREVVEMCRVDCCAKVKDKDRKERDEWALMYVRLRFVAVKE